MNIIGSLQARSLADNDPRGDGASYDIHSFNVDGADRPIEMNTTSGLELTPLHITTTNSRSLTNAATTGTWSGYGTLHVTLPPSKSVLL